MFTEMVLTIDYNKNSILQFQEFCRIIPVTLNISAILNFKLKSVNINESQYLASFVISGSKQAFLNLLCQYLSFFNTFSTDFARWKSVGLPHVVYIVIH